METFGTRLHRAVAERGPLCVGIDPHPGLLTAWGLSDDVAGLERFCATVVEAIGDRVAVVKPQSAFFERFGARGVGVLESTIRQLRDLGALTLLDVKRGDIGSTVAAYASAYLDPSSPLYVDAVTASPYLGVGSLAPMFSTAAEHGGGVFVLALTSNPEGASVQRAVGADGRTVAQTVIDEISQLNRGAEPLGSFGLVVGATVGETGHDLDSVNGPLLAPGLGAQGGTPAGLRTVFGAALPSVLPSYSREVLGAGPDPADLRAATERVLADCRAALGTAD
ncbi:MULTISPECIES: orotidine-5'-phosphate decarboxylase [Micromonospora]|uniref:Orotidine 5'-phosphate decarboxylase n=1 Tax=Micromonospora tulbaghiae TaxID=479978 RepID=A0AAW4JI26_9ACTN|nr:MULTISPECIES: orotidine-5'-phosphate decarboxylase [Micromonospora]KAB1902276.1 orotidine-5'-phosphate decarboxylase [Micromonospora sp. AMSO1212t]MBO4141005.1 orotidine-5'-phosphate decarboxylase [Micromonospora tulbaghiae]MDX5457062.1 orotidine-5'-phosphate decarboxylase [Micromonospora tulbaghiae]SCE99808.1 orotidine-5'-phosphate decarboxylase [Micromonospora tulbaghiae]